MASKWPDLSMYDLKLMLSVSGKGAEAKKTAVLMSDGGSFDPKISKSLEANGFERKSYEGQMVYTIGSLPPKLIGDLFPKGKMITITTPEQFAGLRLKGQLEAYVEPDASAEAQPADELDTVDASVFENLDEAAEKPARPKPEVAKPAAPAKARKAAAKKPAASKPAAEKKAPAAAEKKAPVAEKTAAAPTQQPQPAGAPLPGWEKLDLDAFEGFLVHEGVPDEVRADYRAAISAMSRHFSFKEIFETAHPVDPDAPNKGYGSVLRERLKTETKHKDLAKSRIIDLLYGFAKEFLGRSKSERSGYSSFTKKQAAEVDKLGEWTADFMSRFNESKGDIPNFLTTYPRVVRIAGMRTLFDMVAAKDAKAFGEQLKTTDERFSQEAMPGKQFANFMNPVISKLRRDPDAIAELKAKRVAVFGKPEVETIDAEASAGPRR